MWRVFLSRRAYRTKKCLDDFSWPHSMGYTPCERWLIIRAVLNLLQAVFFSYMKKSEIYNSWYCVWFYLISHDISQRDTFLFSANLFFRSSAPLLFRTCKRRSFQEGFLFILTFLLGRIAVYQGLTQFDLSKCNVPREFECTRNAEHFY